MSRVPSRRAVAEQREHEETLARIRGQTGNVGQCDGCPAGQSVLCGECGLCSSHCASDGCGYSPHAWQAYTPDYDNY